MKTSPITDPPPTVEATARAIWLRRRHDAPVGFPCRLGVPFGIGELRDPNAPRLSTASGDGLPLQTETLARWPDGSVKWLLCEWTHEGADEVRLATTPLATSAAPTPSTPVTLQRQGEAIVVRRGDAIWRFAAGGELLGESAGATPMGVTARLDGGVEATPKVASVEVLAEGPVRVTVRVVGKLIANGSDTGVDLFAECHFHADSALRRVSLTTRNRRRTAHPGGVWELGDAGSILLDDLAVVVTPASAVERWRCDLADAKAPHDATDRLTLFQASSGGERWDSLNHVDRHGVVPMAFRGYRLEADGKTTEGLRAQPVVSAESAGGGRVAVAVERYWQNFPKAIACENGAIRVGLFPAEANGAHELQGGEQKTHVVWLADDEASARSLAAIDRRGVFWLDPEQVARTGAERFVRSVGDEEHSTYRQLVQRAVEGESNLFEKREAIDEYGWRHFGDAYGDHEAAFAPPEPPLISHWNNQYDLVLGLGVRAISGGGPRWLELMEDHAWHVIDIDLYHTDEDKAAYNHGLFWHTIHYIDAGKANHRSYPSGTIGGGPSAEQMYTRGLRLYYCLTGERAAYEAIVAAGDWALGLEDGSKTPFRFLAGGPTGLSSSSGNPDYHGPGRGPGNATETLLTAFELTGDRRYLQRVEELMRRVVHPSDDHAALNLLDAETRWYYNLYLQALGRYLEIKHEHSQHDEAYAYGRQTLLAYAAWMSNNEYPYLERPEILEFPTETWSAQDLRKSEVFHFAARHAGDSAQRERFLERAAFFFEHAIEELLPTPSARYTRPIALLLGSGFSYRALRDGAGELADAPAPHVDPPPKPPFVPQKTRAVKRAKRLVMLSGLALILCVVFGFAAWVAYR